jgi:hypothetical protein
VLTQDVYLWHYVEVMKNETTNSNGEKGNMTYYTLTNNDGNGIACNFHTRDEAEAHMEACIKFWILTTGDCPNFKITENTWTR